MTHGTIKIKGKTYPAETVVICFSNGYAKNRPQIFVKCLGVYKGYGSPKWGAVPAIKYFCIHLGEHMQSPGENTIFHLNLKKKWFDMIKAGTKTTEYREIKPTWSKVFTAN
jgi:hypothetical protein